MKTAVSILIVITILSWVFTWIHSEWCKREIDKVKREDIDGAVDAAKEYEKEIDRLTKELHKLKLEYINIDGELAGVRTEKETLQLQLDNARERLAKYDRPRGEGGKFVRPDGTYTPYAESEPDEAIELPAGVKMEEVEVTVSCTGGPDIENELSHE